MMEITRREEFSAAHRLFNPDFSDEENEALYGKCANPHYHGHNYTVEVTLRGPVDPATGMTYNLADLKTAMRREIIDKVDHKNLNEDAAGFMKNRIPTAENIAISIWERLEEHIEAGLLHRVRLFENERNFVDYYGGR
ncbi:MAG TPA: 6-pyruvoyl tetrahydrobiopterin synthase [Nitrospinae bacterium]|nr:6-pyruvoyl tetrahydrobiopterin synthase [Nitrospinota bacterium]